MSTSESQRRALAEGFINMSNMDRIEDDDSGHPVFAEGAGKQDKLLHDYVEMDDLDVGGDGEGGDVSEMKENTNIFKCAFHIFKANVGTGVFMLPTFYPDAGYVLAPILAVMIGVIVIDCTHMLLNTKLIIDRRDITTYSAICRFVLGPVMEWILFVALILTQFGFCLMYSQLLSTTLNEFVTFKGSNYLWVSVMFFICFPITLFSDNLSLLSIATMIATVGVFYALICCFIESCMELHKMGGVNPECNAAGRDLPIGWFNYLANSMMVLEGIAIILPVHASCTQKRLLPRTISIVLVIVVVWYLLFGLTGYLAFGKIKNSLVNAMQMNAWGKSIRILFVLNVIFTYPVQFMSAQQLIDQIAHCRPRSWKGILIRLFINLVIWALAMALPNDTVDIVVAFIGALPSTCMVIIIPTMLTMQVHYAIAHPHEDRMSPHYWKMLITGAGKMFTWLRIRSFIYFIIALLIMVIGTYSIVTTQIINRD